jgi:hypothetical protein
MLDHLKILQATGDLNESNENDPLDVVHFHIADEYNIFRVEITKSVR